MLSRSSRAVVGVEDGQNQSCWANVPQELWRKVLVKIEASESAWPLRKNVVACAGVCRSWRHITKEIVKIPELSGILTFPISVKQPGPRDSLIQCFIKRNRSTQTYYLYLSRTNGPAGAEDGKFLLAARKCSPPGTDHIISLHADEMLEGSISYIGKLRSNPLGTEFTIFDGQPPHAEILYERDQLRLRRMQCTMDAIPSSAIEPGGVAPTQMDFSPENVDFSPSSGPLASQKDGVLVLKNKAPMWHEELQFRKLDFGGRVMVASVKNFQLVDSPENGPSGPEQQKIILQFGKVKKDLFTMDFRYPISTFQAFAICLSSFDTKI